MLYLGYNEQAGVGNGYARERNYAGVWGAERQGTVHVVVARWCDTFIRGLFVHCQSHADVMLSSWRQGAAPAIL